MDQSCVNCRQHFEISPEDLSFYESVSPTFNRKKELIPPPTHCPDCRQQRRLGFVNERNLYPGQCGMCKKRTLSQFPPHSTQPYYCPTCWHSDGWDALSYGQDVDFGRPFFEQFAELRRQVPAQALSVQGNNENSDYIHCAGSSKNCYLIMHADFCEDCYYGYGFKKTRSCVDGFYNLHSELLYDCVDCHNCYNVKSSQECFNCTDSAFLRDCVGCRNCFLCVGQRNKEYCFENVQLSKEDYAAKMREINMGSHETYQTHKAKRKELELSHTFKEFQGHNLENSSGNHLYNCKNVRDSFDCEDGEDARFCYQLVLGSKNVYDIYQYGTSLENSYECVMSGEYCYGALFCTEANLNSSNLLYCWYMETSRDCFGCSGMQRGKYCILNKQYTQEEYEELMPKIIEHMRATGEWGEFMPLSYSLFGYNKTSAQMYFPLTKEQAQEKGYVWNDHELPPPAVEKIIPANALPDTINDTPDDVLDWAIECEVTGKPFRLTKQELQFYRNQTIPLPRRSPDQRHLDRFHQRNPRQFWDRECAKCSKQIRTSYSPDRPETVYCESCYLKAVY